VAGGRKKGRAVKSVKKRGQAHVVHGGPVAGGSKVRQENRAIDSEER